MAPRTDLEWHFASFWERLGATLIDGRALLVISLAFLAVDFALFAWVGRVIYPWLPSPIYWWGNAFGKSLGKDAMGIEIVNAQWQRPGLGAGFVRWFISNLSGLVLGPRVLQRALGS